MSLRTVLTLGVFWLNVLSRQCLCCRVLWHFNYCNYRFAGGLVQTWQSDK